MKILIDANMEEECGHNICAFKMLLVGLIEMVQHKMLTNEQNTVEITENENFLKIEFIK